MNVKLKLFHNLFKLGQFSLQMPGLNGSYTLEDLAFTTAPDGSFVYTAPGKHNGRQATQAITVLTPDAKMLQETDSKYKEIVTVLQNALPLIHSVEVRAGVVVRVLADTLSQEVLND